MQSRLDDFNTIRADVIAISLDTPENNLKAVKKLDLSFPILADLKGEVIDRFGVRHVGGIAGRDIARPAVFVLDENRTIIWRSLTDNLRVRVKPSEVIDALGKLNGS